MRLHPLHPHLLRLCKSGLGGAEKSYGFKSSEFTEILIMMALKEVTENLIRDGREERLKQVWSSLFHVWKKT